jgi:hypothetical protein
MMLKIHRSSAYSDHLEGLQLMYNGSKPKCFLSHFAVWFMVCPFKAGICYVMFNQSQRNFPASKAISTVNRDMWLPE